MTEKRLLELAREEELNRLDDGRPHFMFSVVSDQMKVIDYGDHGPLTQMKENLRADGFPLTVKEGLNAIFK